MVGGYPVVTCTGSVMDQLVLLKKTRAGIEKWRLSPHLLPFLALLPRKW